MACLMSQDFINSFQLCGWNFFISLIVTIHSRTGCLITVRSFFSAALRGSLR